MTADRIRIFAVHLTKLRLLGFKSFVDPTEMVVAPGLTGVVGPNGCGKSNLLEALRWAMGETRPTAMRGDGMEDVIFAGAASRPARPFAEVALTLDNQDRTAPAAFNEAESLDVVRRITRDAGSAFRVNGKEARARDVQMMFADAATGAQSPSLVRQGQISELIAAKPRARRRVLEEAAGIAGLFQRRHDAELKLSATTTNLERVTDVITALSSRRTALERQARMAARYRALSEDLRQAEAALLYGRFQEADSARLAAEKALAEALTEAGRAERAAAQAELAQQAAAEAVTPLREEVAIARAVAQRLETARATLEAEARRLDEDIAQYRTTLEQIARDEEREAALRRDAAGALSRIAEERSALEAAVADHPVAVAAAEAALSAAEADLSEIEARQAELTAAAARAAAAAEAARRQRKEAETRVRQSEARAQSLRDRSQRAEAAVAAAQAAMEETATSAAAASERRTAASTALAEAEEAEASLSEQAATCRTRATEASGQLTALTSEVQALERLLRTDKDGAGSLLDQIPVTPGFEAAFAAAFGEDIAADLDDGSDAGARTWRPLPGSGPETPGGQALGDHVTVPDALAQRVRATAIVDPEAGRDAQDSLAPGQQLVSPAGDLWRWDGFHQRAGAAPSPTAARLERRNRLDALREALGQAQKDADETKAAANAAQGALSAARERAAEARQTWRKEDRAAADAEAASVRAASALVSAQSEQSAARDALSDAETDLTEATEVWTALGQAASSEPDTENDALAETAAAVAETRKRVLDAQGRVRGLAAAEKECTARLTTLDREARAWADRQSSAERQDGDLAARRAEAERKLSDASDRPADLAERQAKLASEIDTAAARATAADRALAEGEARATEAAAVSRTSERAAGAAREARAKAEAVAEAAGETATAAKDRIQEEAGCSPADLLARLTEDPTTLPTVASAERSVGRLRREREALGAVNLQAEADREAVAAEEETLKAEQDDLEAAVQKLREGISALNREGRQRLLAAFDAVNTQFAALARRLFGGGEARLALVESDDPLDAGLEILCQPPGKKLTTLSLLSGGEQTLTAISLIFAVFRSNPAPICVLDEVDAPLDDANVARFCDLLDDMASETTTRFLIITHHAVTMARMDRLFGVTMVEPGVSQLVSVDLQQAAEMVEG